VTRAAAAASRELPYDAIVSIVRALDGDLPALAAFGAVCSMWRRASREKLAWSRLTLGGAQSLFALTCSAALMKRVILQCDETLEELDLSGAARLNNADLAAIFQPPQLPNLTTLSLACALPREGEEGEPPLYTFRGVYSALCRRPKKLDLLSVRGLECPPFVYDVGNGDLANKQQSYFLMLCRLLNRRGGEEEKEEGGEEEEEDGELDDEVADDGEIADDSGSDLDEGEEEEEDEEEDLSGAVLHPLPFISDEEVWEFGDVIYKYGLDVDVGCGNCSRLICGADWRSCAGEDNCVNYEGGAGGRGVEWCAFCNESRDSPLGLFAASTPASAKRTCHFCDECVASMNAAARRRLLRRPLPAAAPDYCRPEDHWSGSRDIWAKWSAPWSAKRKREDAACLRRCEGGGEAGSESADDV